MGQSHVPQRFEALRQYIVAHSNLPGPRGNLELAAAWADVVGAWPKEAEEWLWELLTEMASLPASQVTVNDPHVLLAFCGVLGIGVLAAASDMRSDEALATLRGFARDSRWRMREAVAMALQPMLVERSERTLSELQRWVSDGDWLEMRAAAAALAEPTVLQRERVAMAALHLHESILSAVLSATDRRVESFRILRKGLGYTLSVVVSRVPDEGFQLLARLVPAGDADILWIVRQNLKKKRLAGRFHERVEALQALLLKHDE